MGCDAKGRGAVSNRAAPAAVRKRRARQVLAAGPDQRRSWLPGTAGAPAGRGRIGGTQQEKTYLMAKTRSSSTAGPGGEGMLKVKMRTKGWLAGDGLAWSQGRRAVETRRLGVSRGGNAATQPKKGRNAGERCTAAIRWRGRQRLVWTRDAERNKRRAARESAFATDANRENDATSETSGSTSRPLMVHGLARLV
jgi:hypothetical protein